LRLSKRVAEEADRGSMPCSKIWASNFRPKSRGSSSRNDPKKLGEVMGSFEKFLSDLLARAGKGRRKGGEEYGMLLWVAELTSLWTRV